MRVAVTAAPRSVLVEERPEPSPPGPGQTLVRVEMVGICGSDLHLYRDELGESHVGLLPRVMGHEFSAIVEQADPAGSALQPGDRVAMWPMLPCGACHTCRDGRPNVCANLRIIGVHDDGALQERFIVPTTNLVATPALSARQTSLIEPVAVSVHAVNRGRVAAGEQVVVLGAGPIGAAAALACRRLRRRGPHRRSSRRPARAGRARGGSPPTGSTTSDRRRGSPTTVARTARTWSSTPRGEPPSSTRRSPPPATAAASSSSA